MPLPAERLTRSIALVTFCNVRRPADQSLPGPFFPAPHGDPGSTAHYDDTQRLPIPW